MEGTQGTGTEAAGLVQFREEKAKRVYNFCLQPHKERYRGDRTKPLEMQSEKLEGTSPKSYQEK